MANIIDTIKKARKRGVSDDEILEKIIEQNPQKADTFKQAKERGATSSLILEKIIQENKSEESESDEEKDKDKKGTEKEDKEADEKEKEKAKEEEVKKREKKRDASKKEKEAEKKEQKDKKKQETEKSKKKKKATDKETLKEKLGRKVAQIKGTRFFGELLSATRYLLVGVDISDHSIEVLLLDKDGSVTSYGRSVLDDNIVHKGEILNQKALSESLKETLRNTKPQPLNVPEHTRDKKVKLKSREHKAIVSLPEERTYVQVFNFDTKGNLYSKIEEKVKNLIPFDYDELYWDFVEIPSKDKGVKVLCVAAQRDIVDMYIYFFKSTNVEPVAFEVQGSSIGRAILPLKTITKQKEKKEKKEEVMADGKERIVLDMGARTTILSIFNKNADLAVSVPLPYGGNYLTRKVADYLDVSKERAEQIKQKNGFKPSGKTYDVLEKHGEKIVKEIKEAVKYYNNEFGSEPKEILLAGGTALLPDIDKFLDERLDDLNVKIGDPLKKINDRGMMDERESILYSNVIGLGLRALKKDPIKDGINLLPEEIREKEEKSQQSQYRTIVMVALFVAVAGLVLLGLSIYYLVYLPVPAPIQPLRDRVLMEIEEHEETIDVAIIREEGEEVSVYEGPGEEQDVIAEAELGETYPATGMRGEWVRVRIDDDTEGWIMSEDIDDIDTIPVSDIEEETEPEPESEEEIEDEEPEEISFIEVSSTVGAGGLNLREEPTTNSETITSVPAGEVHEILNEEEDWVMIEVDGETGWVSTMFVDIFEEEMEADEEIEDTIERLME